MARLWAGVAAAEQGQQAGLSAGRAGAGVAPVRLSGRVVAGWRTPGGDDRATRSGERESDRCLDFMIDIRVQSNTTESVNICM